MADAAAAGEPIYDMTGQFQVAFIKADAPIEEHRRALLTESFALMAGTATSPPKPGGNARFGLRACVDALRALADMIEAGGTYPQDVVETTRAMNDDFCMTALTVVYAKRVKE